MKALMTAIGLGLFFSAALKAAEPKQEIANVISSYEAALNASDVEAVLTLYGENPTFMPQHAPAQVGRKAVWQAYTNVFSAITLDIDFTLHELEVNGNTAWARTSSSGSATLRSNSLKSVEGNNELFVFKHENGQWKIHQYLFSTNQPNKNVK